MATRRCSYCGSTRGAANARGDWVCYACGQTVPASANPSGGPLPGPSLACALTIDCPSCGAAFRASASLAGKMVRCRRCQATFIVPMLAPPSNDIPPTVAVNLSGLGQGPAAGVAGLMEGPVVGPEAVPGSLSPNYPAASPGGQAPIGPAVAFQPPPSMAPPPVPRSNLDLKRVLIFTGLGLGFVLIVVIFPVLLLWLGGSNKPREQSQQQHERETQRKETRDQVPPAASPAPNRDREPNQGLQPKPEPPAALPMRDPLPDGKPELKPRPEEPKVRQEQPADLRKLFAELAPSVPLVWAKPDANGLSLGSGFVVQHRGNWYVATNKHVVEDAASGLALIFLNDKGQLLFRTQSPQIRIARMSKEADVALINCDRIARDFRQYNIQPVRLAPPDYQPSVGEKVFAIGHPGAGQREVLPQTLTEGIISGIGRQFQELRPMRFLQTTASVNPGNSGGPLFDLQGQVVGINTLVIRRSPTRDVNLEGLNFALEIRHLYDLLDNEAVSFTEQEIDEMLRRRARRPAGKPMALKPDVRVIMNLEDLIIGPSKEERFTFRVTAGEVVILLAVPIGFFGVENEVHLTLYNPRGQRVLNGRPTRESPLLEYVAPEDGQYTLSVANPNFLAPARLKLQVGLARLP